MHYFYYDLADFEDKEVAKSAKEFTELYQAKYKAPPDAYATIAYTAYMEMFRGFEAAKSFEPKKVSAALMANNANLRRSRALPAGGGSLGGVQVRGLLGPGKRGRAERRMGPI